MTLMLNKTAALSVAKIYQITPSHTKEYGFIKLLQGLLQDGNAIVVANAAAALFEISKEAGKNYIKTNKETIGKLLNALNETNEWGKIYILESIIAYKPKAAKEADEIIERISPFLQHANPAVVLGSTKNILHFLDYLEDLDHKSVLTKKLGAPLITLLSSEPEIQYVALCSIQNIVQKVPNIFDKNAKMLFCRFNDPIYVRLAKIDLMISVADGTNVDLIISELHNYCTDMDQDFVRRSVRAIGQVICKVDRVAKKGIEALRAYINQESGSESALQEAVIAASKVLRKYPKKHELLVKDICAQVKNIDEPDSKAAFIWILGEFAEHIDGSEKMLKSFINGFADEPVGVCLQILTASVKMYIKKQEECEEMVMNVLHLASEESANPDLRDRGYIYWRMLSTDPSATKDVVLTKRPDYTENWVGQMSEETKDIFSDEALDALNGFVKPHSAIEQKEGDDDEVDEDEEKEEDVEVVEEVKKPKKEKKKGKGKDKKKKKEQEQEEEKVPEEIISTKKGSGLNDIDDILGLGFSDEPSKGKDADFDPLAEIFGSGSSSGTSTMAEVPWDPSDIFGGSSQATTTSLSSASSFIKPKFVEVQSSTAAGQSGKSGIKIKGRFYCQSAVIKLELEITNSTASIVSDFEMMFNKNSFGLSCEQISAIPISSGKTFSTTVDCSMNASNADQKTPPKCPFMVQVAIK